MKYLEELRDLIEDYSNKNFLKKRFDDALSANNAPFSFKNKFEKIEKNVNHEIQVLQTDLSSYIVKQNNDLLEKSKVIMGVNEKMDEALEKLDGLDGLSNALLKEEAAIPPSPDAPLAINIQRTYNETPDADAPLAIYIQRTYNETRGFRRVTLYEIKVFTNDREINTIARRFAEFQTLKKKIAGNSSALPIFPASRGIFGFFSRSSPQVIAQRQFQLEEWLQKACTHTNIRRSGQIRDFLFDWDAVERVVGKEAADQMKQGEGRRLPNNRSGLKNNDKLGEA
eukprot:g2747.t1